MEARKTSENEQKHTVPPADKQPHAVTSGTRTVDVQSLAAGTSGISTESTKTKEEPLSRKSTEVVYDSITYIGRFQPIHIGHYRLIEHALDQTNNLIIVIGSTNQSRSERNPYNFQEREKMILLSIAELLKDFPEKQCKIIGQDDMPDNITWYSEINKKVEETHRHFGLLPESNNHALIGYKKDDSSFYLAGFPQWQYLEVKPQKFEGNTINATNIRKLLRESREQALSTDQEHQLKALLPEPVKQWIDANMNILGECHSGSVAKPDTTEPKPLSDTVK